MKKDQPKHQQQQAWKYHPEATYGKLNSPKRFLQPSENITYTEETNTRPVCHPHSHCVNS